MEVGGKSSPAPGLEKIRMGAGYASHTLYQVGTKGEPGDQTGFAMSSRHLSVLALRLNTQGR